MGLSQKHNNSNNKQKLKAGAGEMAQRLGGLAVQS